MESFLTRHTFFAFVAVTILLAGCKQPETIVVDESPTANAPSDTTVVDETISDEAGFRKMVIGEYSTISSLNPLFADNGASMRAVQLVFEGLVRLDAGGSVVPGLAKSWNVDNDSLLYTFNLRENIYYQDSDVFSTGTGRRMISDDVKFVFERMAQADVPPKAAHLFMGIKGFDPYYHEQREVYLPGNRKLKGVSGIQTPNDSTVVFELTDQDPDFLRKLATPLAVIYPREAVRQSVESFSPVGTGPFQFSSRTADTTLVFSKFKEYYDASKVQINRVDVISSTSESRLFKAMSNGDIYVLPQLGPKTLPVILDSEGDIKEAYAQRYNFKKNTGFYEYVMRYNPAADLSEQNASTLSALAGSNTVSYFNKFPNDLVTPQVTTDTATKETDLSNLNDSIYSAFSDDPFVKTYLGSLSGILDKKGVKLQMTELWVPSRNTALFFTQNYPLIPDGQWDSYQELFRFRVSQATLQRAEIDSLYINSYPWWFDLRGVSLPTSEFLN